jgi:DNA-binding transcriptional LysR family regulator
MELHQIRYFVALSQLLNFTRAAEKCNITQPALTKAIQKLECEFGGELIYRERQFTKLTELGTIVLPRLEEVLSAADAARTSATDFRKRKEVPLRIGLSTCVSAALLAVLVPEVAALHPNLQLDIHEAPTDRLVTLLFDGEIAAAVSGDLEEIPERLRCWELFEERFVLQTSAHHPLARLNAVPPVGLKNHIWIYRPECKTTTRFWARYFAGGTPPHVTHRGGTIGQLQEMIIAGLGIMLAPEHMPCPVSVVARTIENDTFRRPVRLMVVNGRRRDPALETFIRAARGHDWKSHLRLVSARNAGGAATADETAKAARYARPAVREAS